MKHAYCFKGETIFLSIPQFWSDMARFDMARFIEWYEVGNRVEETHYPLSNDYAVDHDNNHNDHRSPYKGGANKSG